MRSERQLIPCRTHHTVSRGLLASLPLEVSWDRSCPSLLALYPLSLHPAVCQAAAWRDESAQEAAKARATGRGGSWRPCDHGRLCMCHRAELAPAPSVAQSEKPSHDSSVGALVPGAGEGGGGKREAFLGSRLEIKLHLCSSHDHVGTAKADIRFQTHAEVYPP